MTPGFRLFHHGFVALRIEVLATSLTTIVEQELGLVEVFLLTSDDIQFGQGHLGNLVTWYDAGLSFLRANLSHYTVGIALGDVEELRRSCGLVMGTGCFDHMTEVIELVTQEVLCLPTLLTTPVVGMLGVDGTGGIEVAVRFLSSTNHVEHTVDIGLQFLVGIGLQHVAGPLDGLVDISIVEGEEHDLRHIPLLGLQTLMTWVLQGVGCHLEVLVTMHALTFREC